MHLQFTGPNCSFNESFFVIEEFSFVWNDKRWKAYFNALVKEKVIVHFEDTELRDLFGAPLIYTFDLDSDQDIQLNIDFPAPYNSVLAIIKDSIESKLGMPLVDFLVVDN